MDSLLVAYFGGRSQAAATGPPRLAEGQSTADEGKPGVNLPILRKYLKKILRSGMLAMFVIAELYRKFSTVCTLNYNIIKTASTGKFGWGQGSENYIIFSLLSFVSSVDPAAQDSKIWHFLT